MKNIVFVLVLLVTTVIKAQCPAFQNNLVELGANSHFKDLSTVELLDGSQDFIIAGTKFTNTFNTQRLFIVRVEEFDGSRVWSKDYINTPISRGFDVIRFQENGQERIAVTGYIDGGQFNKMHITVIDAANGNVLRDESYEVDPNFNSQGLNIIYTERNFNGVTAPGFMVVGYYNFNYDVNFANNSAGFIMRTDLNLNPLWIRSSFSQTTAAIDYDMMNDVTETNDGYFVTGSVNEPTGSRQGVLLAKFDENGNTLWTNSYLQGNFRDVGVDTYYESSTNRIYLLTYYSNFHYFGLTTIDNTTGSIILNNSWRYSNANQLNRTGFKITRSIDPAFPDDLVIMGYEKEAQVQDPTGPTITANSVPFAVSLNKNTGIVNRAYTYPVSYQDNASYQDYFRFWDGQSPLIYHPEIGFTLENGGCHFMVANRSSGLNKTAIEMIKLDQGLLNVCLFDSFPVTESLINLQVLPTTINSGVGTPIGLSLANQNNGLELENCEFGGVLALNDNLIKNLKIYPNPTQDRLYISSETSYSLHFSIKNITGKVIKSRKAYETQGIDVSSLISGVYIVTITNEGGNFEHKKLIIE